MLNQLQAVSKFSTSKYIYPPDTFLVGMDYKNQKKVEKHKRKLAKKCQKKKKSAQI